MSDTSPILGLPFIQPAQAQKHVTHNEALRLLDVLVQASVLTRGGNTPPATPALGDRHIIGSAPTGAWAGQPDRIAFWEGASGWGFLSPMEGWTAHVAAEDAAAVFIDGAWVPASGRTMRVARLGIGTDADATNRLAVASEATLLSHIGAGHQVKVNKSAAGDTASLLFQTGWSGRAEMGTAGSDDFAIKVSPNGTTFSDALRAAAATGIVTLPQGVALPGGTAGAPAMAFAADTDTGIASTAADQIALVTGGQVRLAIGTAAAQLDLPLTGTSVTQSATDTTDGRLLRVGDFGAGALQAPNATNVDDTALGSGLYRVETTATGTLPPLFAGVPGLLRVERQSATGIVQTIWRVTLANGVWMRTHNGTVWSAWVQAFAGAGLLGTVSQTSGTPTGALIESGSVTNGRYRRFACGLQICWRDNLSVANASTAVGTLFRSADLAWTYPVAFLAGSLPVVTASALDPDCWCSVGTQAGGTSSIRVLAAVTKAAAITVRATAVGRWY